MEKILRGIWKEDTKVGHSEGSKAERSSQERLVGESAIG
jgi:hypothetical protein